MKSSLLFSAIMAVSVIAFGQTKNDKTEKDAVDARFKEFIATENRGDSLAVRKMAWRSPDMLFIATGKADENGYVGWGIGDAMQHFEILYRLNINIKPEWDKEKISFLNKDVARIFVPVAISLPVRPVPNPFYLVTDWIKQGNEWKLATNIAIPVPH